MHFVFARKTSSLLGINQTRNFTVIISKEGSTKIVNLMTNGAGVIVLGRVHISHK